MTNRSDSNRPIRNLDGESLGMTVAQYDAKRSREALSSVHTLCHAPFTVMDLGPQGQVTTCNHFHRFIGNLHSQSWLDIFRGEDWTRLRQNMLDYRISEHDCRHCARQIRSGHPGNAFAQEHFDPYPATTATPRYPTVIIFRLSNVCNLMCVMCNGTLSHRIRKERENLPPLPPPPYGEQFFAEMEETLPHVRYVEFYGGEPFLVKEHLRILDILEKTGAKTEIYVNTNGTSFTDRIKGYIERLNFVKIAVSVDAIYEVVHARQRVGIKHDVCMANLQWLLDLRHRKKLWVGLNTTETRFNWYHLPVMYQFAADKDVYIHINTCLHPSDTTLYDLPTEELAYIGDWFARSRTKLGAALQVRGNAQSYGHLEAMVRDELTARRNGTKRPNPYPTDREPIHGGLMSVPELKAPPFATPEAALVEIDKVQEFEAWDYALRMATAWREAVGDDRGPWARLRPVLDRLIERATPLAARQIEARRGAADKHTVQQGWRLEGQGRFGDALAAVAAIAPSSEHHGAAELLRARARRRLGRFDEARESLHHAFAAAPTDVDVFVELAWLGYDTGDVAGARTHARRARDLARAAGAREKTANWAHVLGALAISAGDLVEAGEALKALEQVRPNDAITLELRDAVTNFDTVRDRLAIDAAWRLERTGRFAEAIAAVASIGAGAKLAYEAAMPRARALRRSQSFAEARRELDTAIAANPDRAEAWVEAAWLAYDANELEQGLAAAAKARGLGGNPMAWAHAQAVLAVAAGRADEAIAALSVLHADRTIAPAAAHPGGADGDARDRATITRGWDLEARGDYAGAQACTNEVPDGSPRRRDALVLRSRAQRRRDDLPGALRTLALSLAIEPVQLEALLELAWMAHDRGLFADGIRFAERARQLSMQSGHPAGVVGWAHPLGRMAAMHHDENALAACRESLTAATEGEPMARAILAELNTLASQPAARG